MSKTVDFHPVAMEDAEAARDWYSVRSPIVAGAFTTQLNKILNLAVVVGQSHNRHSGGSRNLEMPGYPLDADFLRHDKVLRMKSLNLGKYKSLQLHTLSANPVIG